MNYIDSAKESMGNFLRTDGWTEEIILQAAAETGFVIETREATHGQSSDEYFSVWRTCGRDKTVFWNRARELMQEATA